MEQVAAAADEGAPGHLGKADGRPDVVIATRGLRKQYGDLVLFDQINFELKTRQMLAIVGQSGAGKSTLLHILGALDTASAGEVYFESTLLRSLTPVEAADFRNREIGYVWQFHYLLPEFTAAENVALPLLARGQSKKEALQQAVHWLDEVGLADRSTHRAGELSGGEQQRVSIARALITAPKLLLADEPTGDLDDQTADALFALIERLHASYGLTSILVTHNLPLARRCERILRLAHGRMEELSPLEL
ncbi:MAG TPA: ABC transporter ATP-binding protein [Acidobacteriaceae bacterium]|nr:ABC transporter ATP-binding protein [Acidobacteriaceae bacterium]